MEEELKIVSVKGLKLARQIQLLFENNKVKESNKPGIVVEE